MHNCAKFHYPPTYPFGVFVFKTIVGDELTRQSEGWTEVQTKG